MARPEKKGLQSFSFDVDFFDDEKIEAIAGEFGIKGEIVAVKLLCAIYRNGYFIEWNDIYRTKLLRNLPGISGSLLDNIVQRLVKCGFFDKTIFDSTQVLTSRGIQNRYFADTRRRRLSRNIPYLLVQSDAVPPDQASVHVTVPEVSTSTIPATVTETPVSVPKASALAPFLTGSPQPPAQVPKHIADILNDLQQPTVLRENLCMRFHITYDELIHRFTQFQLDCQCREIVHNDRHDAINHFFSWLNKQNSYTSTNVTAAATNKRRGVNQLPPSETAEYNGSF